MTENFQAMATLAAAKMRSVFPATPLLKNELLSERYGAEIYLKREDLSPVRSYKLRGAFNAMRKVIPEKSLFVCASAGNHAQGVAFMCKYFGVKGDGLRLHEVTTGINHPDTAHITVGNLITHQVNRVLSC